MNKIEICRWMEYTELETLVSVLIAVIFEQISFRFRFCEVDRNF